MTSAVMFSGASTSERAATYKSLPRRILDAVIRSRMATAERIVRRYQVQFENAQVYGDYRRVPLRSADLLPFNN
jgi:hypothetical protein